MQWTYNSWLTYIYSTHIYLFSTVNPSRQKPCQCNRGACSASLSTRDSPGAVGGNLNLPRNLSQKTLSVGEAWTALWCFLNVLFSAISFGTVALLHLHISCFQSCESRCKIFHLPSTFRTLKLLVLKICNRLNQGNTANTMALSAWVSLWVKFMLDQGTPGPQLNLRISWSLRWQSLCSKISRWPDPTNHSWSQYKRL